MLHTLMISILFDIFSVFLLQIESAFRSHPCQLFHANLIRVCHFHPTRQHHMLVSPYLIPPSQCSYLYARKLRLFYQLLLCQIFVFLEFSCELNLWTNFTNGRMTYTSMKILLQIPSRAIPFKFKVNSTSDIISPMRRMSWRYSWSIRSHCPFTGIFRAIWVCHVLNHISSIVM